MRFRLFLAALVTVAAPTTAAQPIAAPPPVIRPAPPPVIRLPPPPPSVPATVRPEFLNASQIVGGKRVDLMIAADRAAVLEWPAGQRFGEPRVVPLETSFAVLAFLADRRYEFLWSPLTAWAGADLAQFRERLRQKAQALSLSTGSSFPLTPAESVTSGRLSDFIRLTGIYLDIGERELAQAVMEKYLAATRPRGGGDQRSLNWILAKARLATVMQTRDKVDESFVHYDDIQRVAGRHVDSVNGAINHAAVLAEVGRYGESLQRIDAAWAFFIRKAGAEGIAGSERQFAWIRACALNGLGRTDEATAALETLRQTGRVTDRNFIVEPKESIEWRAQWCLRREGELKRFLLDELSSERPTPAVLALQPAYVGERENPALLARMRADPAIAAALAIRMRVLSAAMVPPLNKYR